MITPSNYTRLEGCGNDLHGIPMYRILYSINKLNQDKKLATALRIAKLIAKYPQYVIVLNNRYWKKGFVSKKLIKTTKKKSRKADDSTFHWVLTKSGRLKLLRLKERFGAMIEIEDKKTDVV